MGTTRSMKPIVRTTPAENANEIGISKLPQAETETRSAILP